MTAGLLDQIVWLQSHSQPDVNGDVRDFYTDVQKVWAQVLSQKGAQVFEAARQRSTDIIRVKIRWRADVVNGWRCRWNDCAYEITALDVTERRAGWLWFTAQAIGQK